MMIGNIYFLLLLFYLARKLLICLLDFKIQNDKIGKVTA